MLLRKQIKWEKDKQKKKKYTQRGPYTDKSQLESRKVEVEDRQTQIWQLVCPLTIIDYPGTRVFDDF